MKKILNLFSCIHYPLLTPKSLKKIATFSTAADVKVFRSYEINIEQMKIDEILMNLTDLSENIARRKLNIDIKLLATECELLLKLLNQKKNLERQKKENAEHMKMLLNEHTNDQRIIDMRNELNRKGKSIKSQLKNLLDCDEGYRSMKASILPKLLSLPNKISSKTKNTDEIIQEFGDKPDQSLPLKNHLLLSGPKNALHFRSNNIDMKTFYLMNELAILEYKLSNFIIDKLSNFKHLNYINCSDFVKTFVLENSSDLKKEEFYQLLNCEEISNIGDVSNFTSQIPNQALHIVGSSFASFAAFLSTMPTINVKDLPKQYFSMGRSYNPVTQNGSDYGLYDVTQSINVDLYSITKSEKEAEILFQEQLTFIESFQKSFPCNIRFINVGAANLNYNESQRVDFYIYSPGFDKYFQFGQLRILNDHVSKRMNWQYRPSLDSFVHIIHGTILKFPTLIASLIEHHQSINIEI